MTTLSTPKQSVRRRYYNLYKPALLASAVLAFAFALYALYFTWNMYQSGRSSSYYEECLEVPGNTPEWCASLKSRDLRNAVFTWMMPVWMALLGGIQLWSALGIYVETSPEGITFNNGVYTIRAAWSDMAAIEKKRGVLGVGHYDILVPRSEAVEIRPALFRGVRPQIPMNGLKDQMALREEIRHYAPHLFAGENIA